MDRCVIFCADDLGISPGTNEGIRRAAENGIVRETSLCVTGSSAEAGARLARDLDLGVGLHLSLTLGRPLVEGPRNFTDTDGRFPGLARVLRACSRRAVERDWVEREVEAQFARLRDLGVRPTHVNGHHHVHCFPVVRDAVVVAAQRHGVRWIRGPRELSVAGGRLRPKRILLSYLTGGLVQRARAAGLGVLPFVGLSLYDRPDHRPRMLRLLRALPVSTCEWMIHPRVDDEEFARQDRLPPRRGRHASAELATWTDPRVADALRELGVRSVRFDECAAAYGTYSTSRRAVDAGRAGGGPSDTAVGGSSSSRS